MNKKIRWTLGVSSIVSVITIVPITVVACSSNSTQSTVDNYVNQINDLKANTIVGKDTILPSGLTSENANTYLTGIPTTPSGATLAFTFSKVNDAAGTVDITISVSAKDATTKSSNAISVSGFLTSKVAVDKYIAAIKDFKAGTITGKNTMLPSVLTDANIGTYLDNLPTAPLGLIITYTTSKPVDTTGTIDIIIHVAATGVTTQNSDVITVSGFLTSQSAVDKTIETINALKPNTITGKNTILPSVLTDTTISQYLNNVPAVPEGVTLTYKLSNANDSKGTIDIIINVAAPEATAKDSSTILVSDFLTSTVAVNTFISKIKALPAGTITGKTTALPSGLTAANISQYLNNVPSAPEGVTVTYSLSNALNNKESIDIVISATASGITTPVPSDTIKVEGFANWHSLETSLPSGSIYANYWTIAPNSSDLSTLKNSSDSHSLYIKGATSPFDSSQVLSTSGTSSTSLPAFITSQTLPVGLTLANISNWTMVGNNTTGIATYTLNIPNFNISTTLTISGFMTTAMVAQLATVSIDTMSSHTTMSAPADGTIPVQSADKTYSNVGIQSINWGTFDFKLFGGSEVSYAIQNSSATKGTANLIITFKNGVALSIPITGYKTSAVAPITK